MGKWDSELDLTTFSGQNVLEKNLNWYVGMEDEHLMIDFKRKQDDLFAKDLKTKTRKQELKEKLEKEESEFEAEELARKKKKLEKVKQKYEKKKAELEQKKNALEKSKDGDSDREKITKSVSF